MKQRRKQLKSSDVSGFNYLPNTFTEVQLTFLEELSEPNKRLNKELDEKIQSFLWKQHKEDALHRDLKRRTFKEMYSYRYLNIRKSSIAQEKQAIMSQSSNKHHQKRPQQKQIQVAHPLGRNLDGTKIGYENKNAGLGYNSTVDVRPSC